MASPDADRLDLSCFDRTTACGFSMMRRITAQKRAPSVDDRTCVTSHFSAWASATRAG
jgi:hypothetical protein